MKLWIKVCFLVLTLHFASTGLVKNYKGFLDWATKFDHTFPSVFEKLKGFNAWMKNCEKISDFQKSQHYIPIESEAIIPSYNISVWEYSYLTVEDASSRLNGLRPVEEISQTIIEPRVPFIGGYYIKPIPPEVTFFNWTAEGAVHPAIKNQGGCACCYAIASAAALEGQIFRLTGELLKLSDQQIIDCSRAYGNNGCGTGNMMNAYRYIIDQGISRGRSYPFRMRELESCMYEQSMRYASMFDYRQIKIRHDKFLMELVYNFGPVPVGVYSSHFTFINYKDGVYNDERCNGLVDHAMLLVGFGTDPVWGDYWLLKNSYGSNWGEYGYIRMTRAIQNFCNITDYVVLPIYENPANLEC